ncbi:hypothetical protein DE146DRAFT_771032 [Phaeosphaeria sp. MPI-PUGE-AT-0046c]|nr:hypothetical protein DE146DRAFT_771032 [Phaeosphaeria sp. MPI-PUGE-AT-0046c]
MSLYWSLPRHRPAARIDIAIDDALHWLGTSVSERFRDTSFENLLVNRKARTTTFLVVVMAVALIWHLVLQCSSRRRAASLGHPVRTPLVDQQATIPEDSQALMDVQLETDENEISLPDSSAKSEVKATPLMALSQTPCTPQRNGIDEASLLHPQPAASSSRQFENLGANFFNVNIEATPMRHDDPVSASSGDVYDDVYAANLMSRNHSYLKKFSADAFAVNVENHNLREDGTPTKKWVGRMLEKKRLGKTGSQAI